MWPVLPVNWSPCGSSFSSSGIFPKLDPGVNAPNFLQLSLLVSLLPGFLRISISHFRFVKLNLKFFPTLLPKFFTTKKSTHLDISCHLLVPPPCRRFLHNLLPHHLKPRDPHPFTATADSEAFSLSSPFISSSHEKKKDTTSTNNQKR